MAHQHFSTNREIEMLLLAFQVPFLWLHDWVPLGGLIDVDTPSSRGDAHPKRTWTIGVCISLLHFRRPYPDWLYDWLVISHSLLFIGQIRARWIPYLFRPEPKRAALSACGVDAVGGSESRGGRRLQINPTLRHDVLKTVVASNRVRYTSKTINCESFLSSQGAAGTNAEGRSLLTSFVLLEG